MDCRAGGGLRSFFLGSRRRVPELVDASILRLSNCGTQGLVFEVYDFGVEAKKRWYLRRRPGWTAVEQWSERSLRCFLEMT